MLQPDGHHPVARTAQPTAPEVGGDIFDRLGPAEGRKQPAEKKREIDPWLKEEKRQPPARPKAEDDPWLQEEKNSRSSSPALDTPVTQPSSNRIVINRGSGRVLTNFRFLSLLITRNCVLLEGVEWIV